MWRSVTLERRTGTSSTAVRTEEKLQTDTLKAGNSGRRKGAPRTQDGHATIMWGGNGGDWVVPFRREQHPAGSVVRDGEEKETAQRGKSLPNQGEPTIASRDTGQGRRGWDKSELGKGGM